MKKKIISLCLVIALVATAIAGATLAYFTDVTKVNTNTFTVGDVDIKLDETDIKNPNGDRVTENEYKNIYPNQTVVKDPMVTFVKDSRDCYVRMLVTVDYDKLVEAFPKGDTDYAGYWGEDGLFMLEKLVVDEDGKCTWDRAKWPVAGVTYETEKVIVDGEESEVRKFATYEFRYYTKLVAPKEDFKLPALFTSITFPANMTNEQIAALNGFKVDVVAHAMQAEGFETAENPMAAAWAAWTASDAENLATVPTEATEATVETTEVP